MTRKSQFLTTGLAACQLGVSPKALRLYEEHHLITPGRTRAGWRTYGPVQMERARDIIALRKLGLGLAEIAAILESNPTFRGVALARHQSRLESQMLRLGRTLREITGLRNGCQVGSSNQAPGDQAPADEHALAISFDLPWPWGGERFTLRQLRPLTYITGPLGSGKTRLAMRLAASLPGSQFLGLDRLDPDARPYGDVVEGDRDLAARCDLVLDRLEQSGATMSSTLATLVAAICSDESPLVIDMVEQGLDTATQLALSRYLRNRQHPRRPVFLMTRSTAILDLAKMESGETIIYCPANHSPPLVVHPDPTCVGYEAVTTCLAPPDVRARTAGTIAARVSPGDDSRETFS